MPSSGIPLSCLLILTGDFGRQGKEHLEEHPNLTCHWWSRQNGSKTVSHFTQNRGLGEIFLGCCIGPCAMKTTAEKVPQNGGMNRVCICVSAVLFTCRTQWARISWQQSQICSRVPDSAPPLCPAHPQNPADSDPPHLDCPCSSSALLCSGSSWIS